MIIWLNGTFGAGKTTTAKELTTLLPESRIFDSEYVGYLLRHVLASEPVQNFQDWRPWRQLVVATATQVLDYVGGTLVIPQSVLTHQYWQEIRTGFEQAAIPLRHIVLHADRTELTRRIESDTVETIARQWRLDHLTVQGLQLRGRGWWGRVGSPHSDEEIVNEKHCLAGCRGCVGAFRV